MRRQRWEDGRAQMNQYSTGHHDNQHGFGGISGETEWFWNLPPQKIWKYVRQSKACSCGCEAENTHLQEILVMRM